MGKKLQRSRNHKIVSGICGGLGEYFDVDPIIFRFAFVALLLAGGSSIIIYLILLMVVPKAPIIINMEDKDSSLGGFDNFQQKDLGNEDDLESGNRTIFGLILISGGAFLLLNNLVKAFNIEKLWPAIIVIIGLGLLFQKPKKDDNQNL